MIIFMHINSNECASKQIVRHIEKLVLLYYRCDWNKWNNQFHEFLFSFFSLSLFLSPIQSYSNLHVITITMFLGNDDLWSYWSISQLFNIVYDDQLFYDSPLFIDHSFSLLFFFYFTCIIIFVEFIESIYYYYYYSQTLLICDCIICTIYVCWLDMFYTLSCCYCYRNNLSAVTDRIRWHVRSGRIVFFL